MNWSPNCINYHATCGGAGTSKRRICFRNFRRAAGRIFIITPWPILREVSDYELRVHLQDADFERHARAVLHDFHAYLNEKNTWGRHRAPQLLEHPVAYFSAEFGFHESLPISAGGLGILAGDHAKSASDLGLGFVGVSLFYREGYFQQAIDANNWQTEYYSLIDPQNVPLEPVLNADGQPLVCEVEIGMDHVAFPAPGGSTSAACRCICSTRTCRKTPSISAT